MAGLDFIDADARLLEALKPHLAQIAALEDGLCVYFEAVHTDINSNFKHLPGFADIRVLQWSVQKISSEAIHMDDGFNLLPQELEAMAQALSRLEMACVLNPLGASFSCLHPESGDMALPKLDDGGQVKRRALSHGKLQPWRQEKRTGDGCFARLANNERFQHITLGVIVLNALWIFVDVQWNHSALRGEDGRLPLEPYSIAVENAFCTYFTLEVICRFLAFRKFRYCFIDAWFVFDLTLVIFMVLETWVLALIELASGGFNAGGGVLSNLSSFRLLRLLRLTRVARLMRFFPELLTLVKGMVRAMQSVGFILLFMVVVTYVFAIVFTSQLGEWDYVPPADAEDPTAKELFGDMGSSMMTLFTNGVLVDDLTFTLTEIRKESLALMWAFMVFIIISGMTLLNMLIGVLCQVIEDSSREEAEARQLHELKMCLVEAFQATDESQDGLINEEEWAKIATNKKVQAALLKLGVEDSMMEERLKQMQESLFGRRNGTEAAEAEAAEEPERQDGLSFEEFVDQVADLRMDTPASAMEVEMLMPRLQLPAVKVHLFGHIHEQRGHWDKTASGWYAGGSEYRPNLWNPQVFKPNVPPPQNYPVEVESNNAMANQPLVDNSWGAGMSAQHLVGRPRLITGQLCTDGWHFSSWIP
ncbi:unnamed protein product [Effrenium voratum]|nr:unnamed protein product [Effrenium voratum]